MAPELVPRVFRQFWRAKRRGGAGLGLYIVKGLVEAHGGTIIVQRAPGGGAEFRFTMPASPPSWGAKAGQGAAGWVTVLVGGAAQGARRADFAAGPQC